MGVKPVLCAGREAFGRLSVGPALEESFAVQAFILSSCMKGGTERLRAYSFEYVATYDQKSLSSEHLQKCNMIAICVHEITAIH